MYSLGKAVYNYVRSCIVLFCDVHMDVDLSTGSVAYDCHRPGAFLPCTSCLWCRLVNKSVPANAQHALKLPCSLWYRCLYTGIALIAFVGDSTTIVSVGELYEQIGAHKCALAQYTRRQQRRCQRVSGQFVPFAVPSVCFLHTYCHMSFYHSFPVSTSSELPC